MIAEDLPGWHERWFAWRRAEGIEDKGDLMLHGTTKDATLTITARRVGNVIQVQGILSINFPDYNIDNPSGGPASVGNVGQMEFVLQLQPS